MELSEPAPGLFQKRFSAVREAIASPAFERELKELRRTMDEPHPRSTGPLRLLTAEEVERQLDDWRSHRRLSHKNSEHGNNYALTHVERHLQTCRRIARHYLHSAAAWPLVHEEARLPGTLVRVTSLLRVPGATGGLASTLAADSSGASWAGTPTGPARARRQFSQLHAADYRAAYEVAIAAFGCQPSP